MTVLRACCVAGFASVMLASACATVNSAEGRGGADTVLVNGAVYTGDAASPWAEAVAISDGRVLAVGSASQLAAHAGAAATVIDLEGRMAMPGLIDSHLHPMDGALKALFSCNFPFSATLDDIADTVSACVAGAPDSEWIVGGQWDSDFFVNNTLASPRSWLDRRSGDYAVVLIDDSGHNVWVNSLALEKMGVDAATPDPDGGRIRREADGTTPNGVLEETAAKALRTRLPVASLEDHVRAGREVQRIMLGHGVIGMKSARATDRAVEAFAALDAAGELKMRFTASLETPYGARAEPLDVAGLAAKRDGFASEHVRTSAVKIFLDGVPTASRTARMLAPYVPNTEHGARYLGEMHLEPDRLTEDVIALDAAGFAIKIHTAGDGSVRVALDAIAAARAANGPGGPRHELAHAGYVHPDDVPRFAELNVAPDFSPILWHPSAIIRSVLQAVGVRGERYWPTRDLIDAGATVVAGSDWPSAVASPNPWPGVEAFVTRRNPFEEKEDTLWSAQAVTLEEALRIWTVNGAETIGLAGDTGVIAPGYRADLIVLDRNLFEIDVNDISGTEVLLTMVEGEVAHAGGDFASLAEPSSDAAASELNADAGE